MQTILLKSFTFLFIVSFGYILKKKGFFKQEDAQFLSKVVSRITLPCVVLGSVQNLYFDAVPMMMLMTCIIADLMMAAIAKYLFRHDSPMKRASAMINSSGFNVANVSIPFVSAFLPVLGMSYTCMFDIGNSIGWLGLNVAWANTEASGENHFSFLSLIHSLMHSIPFLTYVLITILGILQWSLPSPILSVVQTIGTANTFLVVLMIGLMIDIHITKKELYTVLKIVSIRLVSSLIFMIIAIFLLPVSTLAKQVLILCLVPSAPNIAIVFSKEIGDSSSIPAIVNSISLILGILFSTVTLILFL